MYLWTSGSLFAIFIVSQENAPLLATQFSKARNFSGHFILVRIRSGVFIYEKRHLRSD